MGLCFIFNKTYAIADSCQNGIGDDIGEAYFIRPSQLTSFISTSKPIIEYIFSPFYNIDIVFVLALLIKSSCLFIRLIR